MRIITFDTIDSTNREALRLAGQGEANGTTVLARTQTMGRGRLGKSWQSPAGQGLYCSIIVRPRLELADLPRLTFVAGLAVAEAIDRLCMLTTGLKWPNDIYFGRQKCGGILTESSSLSTISLGTNYVVVGIGLNVNTASDDFPKEIRETATSLYLQSGRKHDIEEVFERIHSQLLSEIKRFEQSGFHQAITRWRKRDIMKGKRMTWLSVRNECIEGISLGADDSGLLHVLDDNGHMHEVLSGDVQLAVESPKEKKKSPPDKCPPAGGA